MLKRKGILIVLKIQSYNFTYLELNSTYLELNSTYLEFIFTLMKLNLTLLKFNYGYVIQVTNFT